MQRLFTQLLAREVIPPLAGQGRITCRGLAHNAVLRGLPSPLIKAEVDYLADLDTPMVQRHIAMENILTEEAFRDTGINAMRARFRNEILGYSTNEHNVPIPERNGKYLYTSSIGMGVENANVVYHRRVIFKDSSLGREEVVLDMNDVVRKKQYAMLGVFQPSRDDSQRFLAYTVDTDGSEFYTLLIRDLHKGRDRLRETVAGVASVVWAPYAEGAPQTLYYVKMDDKKRAYAVYAHVIGTSTEGDRLLFEELDESKHVEVVASKDGQLVTINVNRRDTSEVYILHAAFGSFTTPTRIAPIDGAKQYFVTHSGGYLLLVTNAHGATNYKVLRAKSSAAAFWTSDDAGVHIPWSDWISARPDAHVHDIDAFNRFAVVFETAHGRPRVLIVLLGQEDEPRLSTVGLAPGPVADSYYLNLPGDTSDVEGAANNDPSSTVFEFTAYSSTQPAREYAFSIATLELVVKHEAKVGGAPGRPLYASSDFCSYQLMSRSPDGAIVPVTIVHRSDIGIDVTAVKTAAENPAPARADLTDWGRDAPFVGSLKWKDWWASVSNSSTTHRVEMRTSLCPDPSSWVNNNPTLVRAYGSYGQVLPTSFSPRDLPLLSRGWVLSYVHARGGAELGQDWYHQGKLLSKVNTFLDVATSIHTLIKCGLTRASYIAMDTESAGGLISGYIANNFPKLVRAHILRVPFLDILHDLSRPDLPLSIPEYLEFGDPRDDSMKRYIASYDPVLNVKQQAYPSMFLVGAMEDSRVPPYHPLKFAMLARAASLNAAQVPWAPGAATILCKILEDAGHFGSAGKEDRAADKSMEYAFLYRSLGLTLTE
jgi:protease II